MWGASDGRDRGSPLLAVVPAYEASATVAEVVTGIRRYGVPVLVVDDGSTDGTGAAASAAGAHVVRHAHNRGKGAALVTGFRWAMARGAEHVLTLDADGQHDPADIPGLTAVRGTADLVVGRRLLEAGHVPERRLMGNRISTFFISLFCGASMPDTQCGFRLYSRTLLTRLPLRGGRFEMETELLMRAHLLGLPVRWVPVRTIYPHGALQPTHFRTWQDTLRVIAVVVRSPCYPRERR